MQELDAGTVLTHLTSDLWTPLYYRGQEVLSAADDVKSAFNHLMQLLNLPLIDQASSRDRPLREEEVTWAPIIALQPMSEENVTRMNAFRSNFDDLSNHTRAVGSQVDALLISNFTSLSFPLLWKRLPLLRR